MSDHGPVACAVPKALATVGPVTVPATAASARWTVPAATGTVGVTGVEARTAVGRATVIEKP